jgi:hypothetical protein
MPVGWAVTPASTLTSGSSYQFGSGFFFQGYIPGKYNYITQSITLIPRCKNYNLFYSLDAFGEPNGFSVSIDGIPVLDSHGKSLNFTDYFGEPRDYVGVFSTSSKSVLLEFGGHNVNGQNQLIGIKIVAH